MEPKLYEDREFLHLKYCVEKLSTRQIAAEICSSKTAILDALKKFGIPLRNKGGQFRRKYGEKSDKRTRGENYLKEQEVLDVIFDMRRNKMSLGQIARYLNQTEVPAPGESKQWSSETVRRILFTRIVSL